MADGEYIAKSYVLGGEYSKFEKEEATRIEKAESQAAETPEDAGYLVAFKIDGIEPPYDLPNLCKIYEHSNSLRQNVNAYMTNIDGFGHVFEPVIDLREETAAREVIRDALLLERQLAAEAGLEGSILGLIQPTEDEISMKLENIRYAMRVEKARIESFFENCVVDSSFPSLRQRTREDREVTGNAYWEIIRDDAYRLQQFVMMPSRSMRVSNKKSGLIPIDREVRVGALTFRKDTVQRRFKRYLQQGSDGVVWFKEYGDPTVLSAKTGKSYKTIEELQLAEEDAVPANEVFHFKVGSVRTNTYGVPRWIGNLLSVLGSRSAEEVNFAYFENKSIPPLAILVSGGRLGSESVRRIEDFVENQLKGKKNFHKILVIEAETSAGAIGLSDTAGAMRVEIKQLTDAQLKDGLFLNYDAANLDKVGMGFRLPRLLRGDIRDFNRASAEAALDFAESQVFVPERNDFDFLMNRFFLPELSIKHWRFKSNGPRLSDAQTWGEMIKELTVVGVLTPEDGRELASKKILGADLPKIKADWVKQPLPLTIAGVQLDSAVDNLIPLPGSTPAVTAGTPTDLTAPSPIQPNPSLLAAAKTRLLNEAKKLINLRDVFYNAEAATAVEKYKQERIDEGEIVFNMTSEEMEKLFDIRRS